MAVSQLYPILPENLPTIHTSVMLRRLIDNAPPEHFTLDWLIGSMPNRSYGVVILFLALLSFIPVAGVIARLIIMYFALQIIMGHQSPVLPERLMLRRFSTRHLTRIPLFTFRTLGYIEKSIRPRWSPFLGGRRLSGAIVFLVCLVSILVPLPLANVPAAAIVALMALAYLEHDGLLLVIAQAMGLGLLVLTTIAILGATHL
jgi:hypothetical protein